MSVLCYAAMLHIHRGEPELVLARLAAAETLAREQRMSPALAPQVLRGAALFLRGEVGDAIVSLRAGLPPGRTGGVRPLGFCTLAEALAHKGQFNEALATICEAQQTVAATGEGAWNPELHRSHGLVLLCQNKLTECEAAFHRAIQLAQQQQAKSWELRAATSLARLWGERGRRAEAQELLAPVYGRFTEGFDTRDLREAKVLLGALG
jgi:predicted ATPase